MADVEALSSSDQFRHAANDAVKESTIAPAQATLLMNRMTELGYASQNAVVAFQEGSFLCEVNFPVAMPHFRALICQAAAGTVMTPPPDDNPALQTTLTTIVRFMGSHTFDPRTSTDFLYTLTLMLLRR